MQANSHVYKPMKTIQINQKESTCRQWSLNLSRFLNNIPCAEKYRRSLLHLSPLWARAFLGVFRKLSLNWESSALFDLADDSIGGVFASEKLITVTVVNKDWNDLSANSVNKCIIVISKSLFYVICQQDVSSSEGPFLSVPLRGPLKPPFCAAAAWRCLTFPLSPRRNPPWLPRKPKPSFLHGTFPQALASPNLNKLALSEHT